MVESNRCIPGVDLKLGKPGGSKTDPMPRPVYVTFVLRMALRFLCLTAILILFPR